MSKMPLPYDPEGDAGMEGVQEQFCKPDGLLDDILREIGGWECDGPNGPTTVGEWLAPDAAALSRLQAERDAAIRDAEMLRLDLEAAALRERALMDAAIAWRKWRLPSNYRNMTIDDAEYALIVAVDAALDPYEVANQLEGYVGPTTPDRLAKFLLREGKEAAKLADEVVRLRSALTDQEAEIKRLEEENEALKKQMEKDRHERH